MKKVLFLFVVLMLISFVSANVRINEVMPHTNNSYGDEWVELYNSGGSSVSLEGWIVGDGESGNDTITLNISSSGFALIVDSSIGCNAFSIANESCVEVTQLGNGLSDGGDEVFLHNGSLFVDSFSWSSNIKSNGASWSYNGSACTPSAGVVNNCTNPGSTTTTTTTTNNIDLTVDWNDEDIINGDEFEIDVSADDLENEDYDIKVWIENDDGDIISEIFDDDDNDWQSGNNYLNDVLSGPGDEEITVEIRIKDDYSNFKGDATLKARIRKDGGSSLDTVEADIEILEAVSTATNTTATITTTTTTNSTSSSGTGATIKLGSSEAEDVESETEDIKSQSPVLYKSKSEYMKEYSVYGFGLLCVVLIALLLIDRK